MMFFSISLIVTGSLLMLRTQASSHGAGTDAAGELGKIVGRMQAIDRLAPASAINQIVPVGNDVAERAALVAEGDAAIHAARALRAQLVLGHLEIVLAPVLAGARSTGRRGGVSRSISMKPVILPIDTTHRPDCSTSTSSSLIRPTRPLS